MKINNAPDSGALFLRSRVEALVCAFTRLRLRLFIKRRVIGVVILAVQAIARFIQRFSKALVMHKLALAQEADDVLDVGIVGKAQDVVIGRARLLLCYYHVFATKLSLIKVRKILIL